MLKEDYDDWEAKHLRYDGITKKYLAEEIQIMPIAAEWANKFSLKHPEKLMLLHLNGEGRSVADKTLFELYFPGHWVYEKGTTPIKDIGHKESIISVRDAKGFSVEGYTVHGRDVGIGKVPHDVLLVETDDLGNRMWDNYEYASIVSVNYERNELELRRGQYGTQARDFQHGKTYIAPVAGDVWGGNIMWYYNFSTACPSDKNGKTASDVFVEEIAHWFDKGGPLSELDGIGFDVNYFVVKHDTWDCDNDGEVDNGIVDGKNIYREGDIKFLKSIREVMGDDFIITADGWNDPMQRAVGILNGMETEGLCRWNDGFRQISRTINQHTYWNLNNDTKYKFSYITSKLNHPNDAKIAPQLRRMGLGLASCLDVAYSPSPDLNIPEMYGGPLNRENWLGAPLGPMQYIIANPNDLLNGGGISFDENMIRQFDLKNIKHTIQGEQLVIEGYSENRREDLVVAGPSVNVETGDLLVFFDAIALDGFVDLDQESLIPRKINVKLEGMPDYPREPMRTERYYNDLAGFMGTKEYTPQMFYFRNVRGADLRLIFEVEEQGKFAIRNLQVYNAPCIISREFENGVIVVNPSFEEVKINLNTVFGEERKFRGITSDTKAAGSNGFQLVNNKNDVNLPGLDAIFLSTQ